MTTRRISQLCKYEHFLMLTGRKQRLDICQKVCHSRLHVSVIPSIRYCHNQKRQNVHQTANTVPRRHEVEVSQVADEHELVGHLPVSITEQLLTPSQSVGGQGPEVQSQDSSFTKVEFPPLYQLAPLVSESDILQKVLSIGVDLSVLEKKDVANDVLRMDFARDVFPILQFLKDNGVNPDSFGKMINKCPHILQQSLEEMKVVISYLLSKKMKKDDITYFLERQPALLCIGTIDLDSKLGCYQQVFKLTGKELRATFHKLTRVISTPSYKIRDRAYYMEKNLGFSAEEMKQMFMTAPRIFVENQTLVANNCDYLHHVMEIPHILIALKPQILRNSHQKLIARHRFLLYLGRAQYDPKKENYVSLDAFVDPGDETWCVSVAKASVLEYNQFMKTL